MSPEAVKDLCERLDDILIEESPMHPFGCATWEESSRIAIDMAKDAIRRAVPMEAVAWREKVARLIGAADGVTWDGRTVTYANAGTDDEGPTERYFRAADAILQALAVIPAPEVGE